jgi:hypothetical protein
MLVDKIKVVAKAEKYDYEDSGDYWEILEFQNDAEVEYWKIPGWCNSDGAISLDLNRATKVKKTTKTVEIWE